MTNTPKPNPPRDDARTGGLVQSASGQITWRDDANTFTATDQLERELIWDALVDYHAASADESHRAAVQIMIDRVSSTFSWMRS